jgi:hypothetical protein
VDVVTPQKINEVLARWGDWMPSPLPSEEQLAVEYEHAMALLGTNPPDYQAGPLTVAASRIGQARRMYTPQAVHGTL